MIAFSSSLAAASSSASAASASAVASLAVAKASLSADAASVSAASSVEAGVSTSLAAAQSSLAQARASASASIASATSSAGAAQASAQASLSSAAASVSANAGAVSSASVLIASSASVLSTRSAALDSVSSSFSSYANQVTASLGSVQSALAASQSAVSASASGLSISLASVQVVQSQLSVSATHLATISIELASQASQESVSATALATSAFNLASSAADVASQTASIASVTSSLAAAATATGLATACLLPTYLGNGHCYKICPSAYPVPFTRDSTYGLCCTEGSTECITASKTAATVCDDDNVFTILDTKKLTGTCTTNCSTVDSTGASYPFFQNGGSYPECVKAADCTYGLETADASSGFCCGTGADTCIDQSSTGATSCRWDLFLNPLSNMTDPFTNVTVTTGSCSGLCPVDKIYSAISARSARCLNDCPVPGAWYLIGTVSALNSASVKKCCADPYATSCTDTVATACVSNYVLDSAGTCVAAGSCPDGAVDNGAVCCGDGALGCTSATNATSCGLNYAGAQTYLNLNGACVAKAACTSGSSVLTSGAGVCCADSGSMTCSSADAGASLTCDATKGSYLLSTITGGSVGTCKSYCAGNYFDSTTSQCVASCSTASAFYADSNGMKHCCSTGAASCTASGPTTCSISGAYFLQPDTGSCAKTCPSGTVRASTGGFCCAKGTSDCTGVATTGDAVKCTSNYYLFDSTCLAVCPSGTNAGTDSTGINVCTCAGTGVASCALDGSISACATGYSVWTPADGSAQSCQKTCPTGTFANYTATAGTCKCSLAAGAATCDVGTGYTTSCSTGYLATALNTALAACAACPGTSVPNAANTQCVYESSVGVATRDVNGAVTSCSSGYSLRTYTGGVTACSSTCYSTTTGRYGGDSTSASGCAYYCTYQAGSTSYAYAMQPNMAGYFGGCWCLSVQQTSSTTYGTQTVPSACTSDDGIKGSSYKLYYL